MDGLRRGRCTRQPLKESDGFDRDHCRSEISGLFHECVRRLMRDARGAVRVGPFPLGAIVTKSMTVEARQGNPLPRYYGFPGGSINSMGLPNLGYRAYAELIPQLKQ